MTKLWMAKLPLLLVAMGCASTALAANGEISNIELSPQQDRAVLVLSHTGAAKFRMFQSEKRRSVILEAENLSIPARLTRMIDISTGFTPVLQLTPYNSMNAGKPMAKLVLQLRDKAEVTTSDLPGKFVLEIKGKGMGLPYIGRKDAANKKQTSWTERDQLTSHQSANAKSEEVAKRLVEVLNAPQDEKKYFGSKVTFEANQADVHDIFRLVGEASELNILSDPDVSAKANFSLKDIPWDQLLDLVIQQGQLKAMVMGNVVRILTLKTYNEQSELKKKEITLSDELEPIIMAIIPLSFADASQIQEMISGLLREKSASGAGAVGGGAGGGGAGAGGGAGSGASADGSSALNQDFKRGQIKVDSRSNSIVVTNTKDAIERIRRLIKEIDVPLPQVLVDAKIVIASENFSRSLGLRWGTGVTSGAGRAGVQSGFNGDSTMGDLFAGDSAGTNGPNFTVSAPAGGFATDFQVGAGPRAGLRAHLDMAEVNGQSKTVASPRVIVNNKKTASISDGTQIAIPVAGAGNGPAGVQTVKADLSLNVTPQVTSHGSVQMTVNVNKSSIAPGGASSSVTTTNKTLSTDVLVDSGSTLVLGGIYQVDSTAGENGIPLLKDLPFIGQLFRVNNRGYGKSELMVFITPQIIDPEAPAQSL